MSLGHSVAPAGRRLALCAVVGSLLVALTPAAGANTALCNGMAPTLPSGTRIIGTPGDDVIIGTPGADTIVGKGGNDTICGLGGSDVIRGGDGDDWIEGGAGADRIDGQDGDDTLIGGTGSDTLAGGRGADQIRAGRGNDGVAGGGGDDTMYGGGGNDAIFGGRGTDRLRAGGGVDECDGENLRSCEMTAVSPGDSGHPVTYLQKRLSKALLYRGPVDGVYPRDASTLPGDLTAAIYAFHKLHQDPEGASWTTTDRVSAEWTLDDWHLLATFDPAPPVSRSGEPDRFEVDTYHEVMWVILDDEVAAIFHVSVGGEFTYWYYPNQKYEVAHTPRGDLDVDHYSLVRNREPGYMYRAWYYKYTHRWMALHGYYTVPPYPASHGCVRVTYDDADWIYARVGIADGWPFHIWDG